MEAKDHNGVSPSEVIGKRFISNEESWFAPSGIIVDAGVDGVGVMMLTVRGEDGEDVEMVPMTLGRAA